jgi:hypothetical protein
MVAQKNREEDFDNDGFIPEGNNNQSDLGDFSGPGEDSFVPDFSDTHDEIILEDGSEVLLRVVSVDTGMGPKGPYKRIGYEIDDQPYTKNVYNIISLPTQNDDPKKKNRKSLRLRDFLLAHQIPIDKPFNWAELVGVEVWAILGVEESEQYGDKNTVKKYTKSN